MSVTIAVVGSASPRSDYDTPVRDADLARTAAAEIGRELAEHDLDILVFSSRADFIEDDLVRGYVASGRARPGSIRVCGRYGFDDVKFADAGGHEEIFTVIQDGTSDWEVSYYRSLLAVDALVLIGGGRSTFIAGLVALSRRIPVAPVAAFGGGAEKVWHYMSRERNFATENDLAKLAASWRPGSAAAVVTSICEQRRQRVEFDDRTQREQRSADKTAVRSLCSGLFLLLLALAAIPASYASKPGTAVSAALLVAAPLFAAMCGAIVRNTFDESRDWLRTAILGAAAGAIAFLLFVAAQLATAPELLNGEGVRRLLFFVIPVGFIAGLTFDAVYSKLRSQDVTRASTLDSGQSN